MYRFDSQPRFVSNDLQQRRRRSGWMTSVLFPILKSFHTDTNQVSELRLRQLCFLANSSHTGRADYSPP